MDKRDKEILKLATAYLKLQNKQHDKTDKPETMTITPIQRAKELLQQYRKNMQKKLVNEPK